jgi:hypothetical protein
LVPVAETWIKPLGAPYASHLVHRSFQPLGGWGLAALAAEGAQRLARRPLQQPA